MPTRKTAFFTARREKGLSQLEASRLSGVPQGIISLLETGKLKNPTWAIVSRLSQIYGVRPEQLIPHVKLPRCRPLMTKILAEPLHPAVLA